VDFRGEPITIRVEEPPTSIQQVGVGQKSQTFPTPLANPLLLAFMILLAGAAIACGLVFLKRRKKRRIAEEFYWSYE